MFSRQAIRATQPLRSNIRRYATENKPSSGTNPLLLGGVAVASALGGYYYYTQNGTAQKTLPQPVQEVIQKATGNKTFQGGEQGFVDLVLESVENVNHNTKKLRFALPDGDVSGLQVASALITKYKGPEMEKPVIRPYTPVSDEDSVGHLDLLVKRYPNGPMSEHIHALEPKQSLSFKGPIPKYSWEENKHNHIALISGGTGITPMYQLCRAIFNNPSDKTKVTLVFGNIGEEDILLKREFEELENKYPQRFRAFYVLDNPPETWKGGKGFITKELLKTVLPEPKSDNIKLFVCGPPGLYKAISGPKVSPKDQGELSGVLKELGYSKDQVYKF